MTMTHADFFLKRTYRKLSAEVAENIALVAPAYEPADQAEVEEIVSLAGRYNIHFACCRVAL